MLITIGLSIRGIHSMLTIHVFYKQTRSSPSDSLTSCTGLSSLIIRGNPQLPNFLSVI